MTSRGNRRMLLFATVLLFPVIPGSFQDGNPMSFNRPLAVDVSVSIITLGEPDLIEMDFTLEVMAVFGWDADIRVCKYVNNSELLIDDVDNVVPPEILWLPDLQFVDAESSKMPSTVNPPVGIELRVSEEDNECHFLEKRRYSLRSQCQFDLRWFPVDVQYCPIRIRSFTYSGRYLTVKWNKFFMDDQKTLLPAFRVNPDVQYLQYDAAFRYSQNVPLPWYWDKVAPGEVHDTISFTVIFYRRFTYQFVNTYIPFTAVVIAAFSVLFISLELSVERVNLAVIALVSLYTQLARIRYTLPSTPFFTACDVYLYACLISVVSTIIVCAFVQRFHKEDIRLENLLLDEAVERRSARSLSPRSSRRSSYLVRHPSLASIKTYRTGLRGRIDRILHVSSETRRSERVNILCRRFMISTFILFLIVYFWFIFSRRPK